MERTSKTSRQTATSSSTIKFTIEQNLPSGVARRGPHSIKRSVDPNDTIVINRRYDEGRKQIFDRADIRVNHESNSEQSSKRHEYRASSSHSISPNREKRHSARSRRREKSPSPHKTEINKNIRSNRSGHHARRVNSKSPRSPETVPYFSDQKRELDRIRRKHERHSSSGDRHRRRSRSRSQSSHSRRHSSGRQTHRSRSRSRERSRRRNACSGRNGPCNGQHCLCVQIPFEYAYQGPIMPPFRYVGPPRFPPMFRPHMPPMLPYYHPPPRMYARPTRPHFFHP